ncbi:MAG: sigma-70 family RNA polymerase sigma factor [Candidatus Hydrogenedentes bacterium]|nr:sigma-70 family RNA polymerase sigma factor [Candidatus Hydrogenedentota bacterium]
MESEREDQHERRLQAAVLAGDETAWRALYERHFDAVYRYVYSRVGRDMHGTEEVVQECWMVAVRRIRAFDPGRGSFGDWLRGIAQQIILGQQRKWARRNRLTGGAPPLAPSATRADGIDKVNAVLASLPEPYETVLRAKYADQYTVAEIAQRWGRSAKAIESLLTRARTAFREVWRGTGDEQTGKEGLVSHDT